MTTPMTPEAIVARLRQASKAADLRLGYRLRAKVDMSADGISARLRQVDSLRRACAQLAQMRPRP